MRLAPIIVLAAATVAPSSPSRIVVATVLSRPIYADQLGERRPDDDDDALERARAERLASMIVPPLKERFCAEHGCNPTEAEMRTVREGIQRATAKWPDRKVFDENRAALTRELAAPGVTAERRKEITEHLRDLHRALRLLSGKGLAREAARARYMVKRWKFNKALHDRYGGEVIWSARGSALNPVGAFRRWLEEEEDAGAFQIISPDLRARFWQRVSSDRGRPVDGPHPFANAPSALAAAPVAPSSPSRIVVATVLSQPIYADQLGERRAGDDDDALERARAERLATMIVAPLKARFCASHGCNPTEAEMRTVREPVQGATPNRSDPFAEKRAALTRELAAPDVTAERRKEIAGQLRKLDGALRLLSGDKPTHEAARYMVESWKFNKALHDRYGGEVIWQPMGLNAVGAFRSWLEEQEGAGAFQIISPDLSASFWQSVSSDRGRPVDDPHPFAKAPWATASDH